MAQHVALNFENHSSVRIITERAAAYADDRMLAPVFPHEFRRVQAHYPIVFAVEPPSNRYRPVALFGLERNENLFLTNNSWADEYLPLAVRMPPFSIGRRADESLSVNIDVEHPRVNEVRGEELFYSNGDQTPFLAQVSEMLLEIHQAAQSLPAFTAILDEMNLIEPFTLEVTLDDGSEGKLVGYHTINEKKLQELGGVALEKLHVSNYLLPTFMIVASLAQLGDLIKRKNALLENEGKKGC